MGIVSSEAKRLLLLLSILSMTFTVAAPLPSQNSSAKDATSTIPHESPAGRLIAEAQAADTKGNVQPYAQHLTEMFVSGRTGKAYIASFAHRLAIADLDARQGKRVWIPESVVAQAFNDMMEQAGEPSGKPLRTDANIVHQLRITLSEVFPTLSTVKSHNSECLPSEAVSLMTQLLARNGSLEDPCPPTPGPTGGLVQHACPDKVFASLLIFEYSHSHSTAENVMLYEHITKLFDM